MYNLSIIVFLNINLVVPNDKNIFFKNTKTQFLIKIDFKNAYHGWTSLHIILGKNIKLYNIILPLFYNIILFIKIMKKYRNKAIILYESQKKKNKYSLLKQQENCCLFL